MSHWLAQKDILIQYAYSPSIGSLHSDMCNINQYISLQPTINTQKSFLKQALQTESHNLSQFHLSNKMHFIKHFATNTNSFWQFPSQNT
ncbi:hypothetical protein EUGRSUZ_H01631 [Eucalyptus grandis]|uniref:Uncharacterized protein n=2 Tax=Eucalyptus grandis TaxID=71139 RepID=A0ACC3JPD8_EUCGR|nr:hypothetical protein EUGRSUZ_H01631 [Eucalyptus grandis]